MTVLPVNTQLLHVKAEQLLQQHRLTEARPLYVEICETAPDDADAWLMLGAIDEQLGLLDDAAEYLRNAISHVPGMAEAYLTLANVLWRKSMIPDAIDVMKQACKCAPDYAEAWQRLGRMQLDVGDPAASLDSLEHANSLNPNLNDIDSDIVEALVGCARFDEAMECTSTLAEEQRDYWKSRIYAARGELNSAIHSCSRVSANSPWYIPARWSARQMAGKDVSVDLLWNYLQWRFDYLAPTYDYHRENTTDAQNYDAVKELIHEHIPVSANVLDLGCGTGRMGRLLRRQEDYLVGIDLSRKMLDHAALQGGYDVLIHADLHDASASGNESFELVILADVLLWCASLANTLDTAVQKMMDNGLLLVTFDPVLYNSGDALHGITDVMKSIKALVDSGDFVMIEEIIPSSRSGLCLLQKESDVWQRHENAKDESATRREGVALLHKGMEAVSCKDFTVAQEYFDHALAINISSTDTLMQLGILSQEQEKYDESLDYYRRVLEIEPDNVFALFQAGTVHQAREEYSGAVASYRQATELGAKQWMLYNNLGWLLQKQDDSEPARRAFLMALNHDPVNRMVLGNLQMLNDKESGRQPREKLELTLEDAAGDDASMLLGFAVALRERELFQRALSLISQAMEMKEDFHDAKMHLALTLQKSGDVAGAILTLEELLEEHPDKAGVYDNLAGALAVCDDIERACLMWEKGSQQSEISAGTHSNRLFMYNYSPKAGHEILSVVHQEWGKALEQAVGPVPDNYGNDRDPQRRLRIGYVSADFYGHSVSHFLEPVMESHNHEQFEIFCYANNEKDDPMTLRLRYYADHWRRINGKDDEEVTKRIRDDGIDILVDLTGHTGGSRLPVFARKPAPVQATWLGYPNTTGLSRIDYRLTDAWADPPGMTEFLHSEQLYRLREGFLCYKPIEFAPAVEVSRGRKSTFTFGCFNNLYKLTPEVIRVWSRILKALPESTLLLKSFGFNADCVYERYTRLFTENGIDPDRIHMMGRLGTREHLDLYNRMDIVLDPFPYNGTTTTCEALWMGVPVIALAGDRHAARVSVSLLSVTGCEELIADSEDEYVQKAIELGQDRDRLVAYKSTLRHRMKKSPLTDGAGFTHQLEEAYREMWRDWCSSQDKRKASHTVAAADTNS